MFFIRWLKNCVNKSAIIEFVIQLLGDELHPVNDKNYPFGREHGHF